MASKPILRKIPVSPNDDYRAGSDGKIYSRTRYAGFGRKDYVDWYPLVGHSGGKLGHLHISLCHKNKKITKSVHRLICMAFHGMPDPPTLQVRHLDGNPKNNLPENLKWGTQSENWLDRKAHGNGNEGEKHPMSKLSDLERERIRWAIEIGLCSQYHLAKILGVTQTTISHICKPKKKKP